MLSIETSAGEECEVDCRKLSVSVQREITRALTDCGVWLRRSAGTRSVKL